MFRFTQEPSSGSYFVLSLNYDYGYTVLVVTDVVNVMAAYQSVVQACGRLRLKCDGTLAETRFCLSAKWTSPFKSAGASAQSTTGSRGVRVSGNNAGYTMFRGSVKSTGYPLHLPVSPSLSLPCVTVCHHISTGLYQQTQPVHLTFSTSIKQISITHRGHGLKISGRWRRQSSKTPPNPLAIYSFQATLSY